MELDNWVRNLAQKRWPILPGTLPELSHVCARHSDLVSFTDVANLCLSDPFLLLDLYRVIGSSRSLQRNSSLPSVDQSLMLMGLEGIIRRFSRVTVLQIEANKLDPEVLEAVGDWLGRGRVAAFLIKEWLSLQGQPKVEDCFIAALIYNLPACLYMMQRNQLPTKPLLQEMSLAFDCDYSHILEKFIQHMPLPPGLNALIGPGRSTRRRQLLRLAMATANSLEQGSWRPTWQVGVDTAAKLINCPAHRTYQAVTHAVLTVAKAPKALGYTFPARCLLMLEGEFNPASLSKTQTLSSEEQLELAIKESIRYLANDLKFARVLYYQYQKASKTLKLRYQLGLVVNSTLHKLAPSMEAGSLFAVLTSKPQSFHAPAAARPQLAKRYPDPFLAHIGEGDFAIMTLFAADQLAGVFYVDNGPSGKAINQDSYLRFKELIARLSQKH